MKTCTRCKNDFEIEVFPIVNKEKMKRSSMCPDCKREYDREYWAKSESRRAAKKKTHNALRDRNRKFIIDYMKSNPCVDCGENDIVVLEFDHQRDKSFDISDMVRRSYSIDRILTEIDKCEVVCANCHRRRTAKQFGNYRL